MALTRKLLSSMGIEADKIDQIIEAHTETVSGLKQQIADLGDELTKAKETGSAESGRLKDVQKELDDLKNQIAEDEKAREGKDYDALKKEYEDYKAEVHEKEIKGAKERAFRGLLSDMNVSEKGTNMILKYMGTSGIELDEEGKLKDATAIKKAVKEDWGDYIPTVEAKGADTKTPPTDGKGSATTKTKEEIMAIKDAVARQKAIAENMDLFGAQ